MIDPHRVMARFAECAGSVSFGRNENFVSALPSVRAFLL
jgi:hypothetical protein